jgi:hypothetical protein
MRHDEDKLVFKHQAPKLVIVEKREKPAERTDLDQVALRYNVEDPNNDSNLHYLKLLDNYSRFRSQFEGSSQYNSFENVAFQQPQMKLGDQQPIVHKQEKPSTNNLTSLKNKYIRNPLHEEQFVPDTVPSVLTQQSSMDPLIKKRIQTSNDRVTHAINSFSTPNTGPDEENQIVNDIRTTYPHNPFPNFKGNQFLDSMPTENGEEMQTQSDIKMSDLGVREMRVSDDNQKKRNPVTQKRSTQFDRISNQETSNDDIFEQPQEEQIRDRIPGVQHSRRPVSATAKPHAVNQQPKKSLLDLIRNFFSLLGPLLRQLFRRLTFLNPYTRSTFRATVNQQQDQTPTTTSFSVYHNHAMAPWQSHIPILNDPLQKTHQVTRHRTKPYDIDYEEA